MRYDFRYKHTRNLIFITQDTESYTSQICAAGCEHVNIYSELVHSRDSARDF